MTKKSSNISIGIEFCPTSLRVTWLHAHTGKPKLLGSRELTGDFTKKKTFVDALHDIKGVMGFSAGDPVVTAIAGKQVHVAQIPFKKVPDHEMKNALRFELRQNLPFDAVGASIGYQWVDSDQIMVAVVGAHYFQHQVECYRTAGLNVQILDVLPLCLSNSMWIRKMPMEPGFAQVCLHFGDENCTLVVDGEGVPFYSRSILFRADKLFGSENGDSLQPVEIDGALSVFGEELRRSLSFYEKNNTCKGFGHLVLNGRYCQHPRILESLKKDVGLPIEQTRMLDLVQAADKLPDYEYDVALTLAMRGIGI